VLFSPSGQKHPTFISLDAHPQPQGPSHPAPSPDLFLFWRQEAETAGRKFNPFPPASNLSPWRCSHS
jgi:hypothetical protein